MSTSLDIELIPEVFALIEEFGKTVTLLDEPYTFGPTGTPTAGGPVQQTVKITPPDPDTLKWVAGDVGQAGEAGAFVAAQGLVVTMRVGLKVVIDDVVWRVVKFSTIRTGDDIALYGMGLTK